MDGKYQINVQSAETHNAFGAVAMVVPHHIIEPHRRSATMRTLRPLASRSHKTILYLISVSLAIVCECER